MKGSWTVTFSDLLTLLLTFFVFMIAVSVFKTPQYKEFWRQFQQMDKQAQTKRATNSNRFQLIKGLRLPMLTPEAEQLMVKLESTFTDSDFDGMNVFCDENKINLSISEELGFDGGSAVLKEGAKPLLLKLIKPIAGTKFDINVEGHSDSQTSPGVNNVDLSLQRALSVVRFLIANGMDKKKLSVSGYGPYRPVASDDTPEGRMKNRRVEVNIMINNN